VREADRSGFAHAAHAREADVVVAVLGDEARRVTFRLHADRTAFTGRDLARAVEPGEIGVAVGGASDQLPLQGSFTLCGPVRTVGPGRVLDTPAETVTQ
jgi:beta-xylosidase